MVKVQIIENEKNKSILHCRVELHGSKSDLRIFEQTPLRIEPGVKVEADLGYLGIGRTHANHRIPHRKPRKGKLTANQKRHNKRFRRRRVKIEHTNRRCKYFRIVKETYRNHLRHITQVWMIVCGLTNLNL